MPGHARSDGFGISHVISIAIVCTISIIRALQRTPTVGIAHCFGAPLPNHVAKFGEFGKAHDTLGKHV